MNLPVFGIILSFAVGFMFSLGSFSLFRLIMNKFPKQFALASFIRQTLNIAFFIVVYFISPLLPWKLFHILLGAALGVTLTSLLLTFSYTAQTKKSNSQKE